VTPRYDGRVVLVTGGSRNIGRAIAERFAEEGAHVIINGVVGGEAENVAAEFVSRGLRATGVDADVSDPEAVRRMIDTAVTAGGRLDVLINNAAVPMVGRVPFFELTLEDWDRSFAVNSRGMFLSTMAAARAMTDGGSVVSISSIGATKAHRSAVAYDATKGAIESFTRAAALELAPYRIRVNAIAPGAISNDLYEGLDDTVKNNEAGPIPWGRVGRGADVAAAAAFLASPDADYITGQVLTVDGGLTAQARQASAEVDLEGRGVQR
jgi:NAD(P)-dependent dehydrogenase (short-subunit alcohol dehydrogenase family)